MKHQDFTKAEYGSIADFCTALELPCRNSVNQTIYDNYITKDHHDWYGADCHTGKDVLKLMRDGWPDGRKRMQELRDQLNNVELTPKDRRRRITRGDMGDSLDIHQVYAGRLDIAWSIPKRVNTFGPQRIDICANMICSGAEHSDVLFWRGAAAYVLADLLEQAGYMVRLVVNFGGTTGDAKGEKTSCRIVVKDHGLPFDVTSTSSVILPGFFRALGHAWIANHAPHKRTMSGIHVGQGIVEPGEVLVSHNVRDHGSALAFVNSTIEKVNNGTLEQAA